MAKHHDHRLPPALDPPDVVQSEEDDPRTSREAPVPERPDPGEERLRSSFETFLDLRRRALTPTRGDPPVGTSRLAWNALLMLRLVVEHGADWAFEALQLEALVKRTRAGSAPGEEVSRSDEAFKRSFLASVVATGLVVPPEFRGELCAGLRALDQGEVQPLLAPARGGRWRDPYSLAQLRAVGLLHAHLRWGRGEKKASAVDDVARAFGTTVANVRKWERSWLPEILGDVKGSLAMARRAGALARQFPHGLPDEHRHHRWLISYLERERPLESVAEEHRRLMAEAARRGTSAGVLRTGPE